jgi:hypothetical protein
LDFGIGLTDETCQVPLIWFSAAARRWSSLTVVFGIITLIAVSQQNRRLGKNFGPRNFRQTESAISEIMQPSELMAGGL